MVYQAIELAQVKLLNLRISVLFQKRNNHKNQKLLITIIIQIHNKRKIKKKKPRNSHLDRQVEINGHNFEIERAQVEKKTPRHGVDLGLNPDIGADGKPILDQKYGKRK